MKKLLTIGLSLLMCLAMLVGCGSNKKADANNTNAKATQTTTAKTDSNATKTVNEVKTNINTKGNSGKISVSENKTYTDKEHVAAYINEFAKLPSNYITKNEAKKLGWQTKGTLDKVAPGKSIGGDRYGNYEKRVPDKNGRTWKECDIDYVKGNRNGKRIVFSNDGLIYYTEDHYKSFTKLY